MLAQALALDYSQADPQPTQRKHKPSRRFSPHERMVMKAEALFPGSEIISHQDAYRPR
jgi:hypothetical protein